MDWSVKARVYQNNICDLIMCIGILCYVFGYSFHSRTVLIFCFVMNIILGLYKLVSVDGMRYGIDYIAYLQQAAAVWNGETDYTKLSSNLGPCFYPAGHIWHYIPAVWLHLYTEHAEIIIKFAHNIILCLVNYYITSIAYLYFPSAAKEFHYNSQA